MFTVEIKGIGEYNLPESWDEVPATKSVKFIEILSKFNNEGDFKDNITLSIELIKLVMDISDEEFEKFPTPLVYKLANDENIINLMKTFKPQEWGKEDSGYQIKKQ